MSMPDLSAVPQSPLNLPEIYNSTDTFKKGTLRQSPIPTEQKFARQSPFISRANNDDSGLGIMGKSFTTNFHG